MPRQSSGPRLVRRKNKPNWFIRYINERSGKQKDFSTGTSNREEAEEKLLDFLSLRRAGRIGQAVAHNQFTVAQALNDYAYHKMGDTSAKRLSYSMIHLLNFWNNDTIDHINIETVKAYLEQRLRSKCTQSTARRELTDLRSAINHAVNMNRILPIKFPRLPKDSSPKKRWLSEDEFARLLWFAGQNYRSKFTLRIFLIIAFYSGQRKEAIMELEWDQFDFDKNTVNFEKANNGEDVNKIKSSRKPRAFQPMPPEMMRFIKRRYERFGKLTNYVFHQKHNPKIRIKSIDKGFRAAARLAGFNDVTPHTLRHTRVSLMLQSGEKPINISEYLKMSIATIERVYGHHNNIEIQEMAQRLGRTQKERTTK